MNKQKRKGFTIVELVIVIAVIAILSAVMIPTFAGITEKANQSAALQRARAAYTDLMGTDTFNTAVMAENDFVIEANGYFFAVSDGQFNTKAFANKAAAADEVACEAGEAVETTSTVTSEGCPVYKFA